MARHPTEDLERTIRTQLTGAAEWNGVYWDRADVDAEYPYCVFYYVSGNEINEITADDAEFSLGVKCVSDKRYQASAGAKQIATLLNNVPLDGVDWYIMKSEQTRFINSVEYAEGAKKIHHMGAIFEFSMQTK